MDATKMTEQQLEETLSKIVSEGMAKNFEQMNEVVSEKINEKIKELGIDNVDLKHRMFPGVDGGDDASASKKERCGKFVKAVFKKDLNAIAEMKDMSVGTDSSGGFLVPTEFHDEVDRIAEEFGLIRNKGRHVPMKRDEMNMPIVSSGATVTWPGETNAGSDGSPTFGNVAMKAKTAVGLAPITNDLLDDADTDVINLLMELFGEALAGAEDDQALNGVGSPFTGILNHSDINVVTMGSGDTAFTSVDLDDLLDMQSQVKASVLAGCGYLMHRTVWAVIQKIKENSQHVGTFPMPAVTINPNRKSAFDPVGFIWGYPVHLSDKMPSTTASAVSTKYIIFGNLRYFYFGDRTEMTLAITDSATIGSIKTFEQDYSAVRIKERVSLNVGLPEAFVALKTAAS